MVKKVPGQSAAGRGEDYSRLSNDQHRKKINLRTPLIAGPSTERKGEKKEKKYFKIFEKGIAGRGGKTSRPKFEGEKEEKDWRASRKEMKGCQVGVENPLYAK